MTPTDAERRKAAEGIADKLLKANGARMVQWTHKDAIDAADLGILHGEQRERERIVKWLRERAERLAYDGWNSFADACDEAAVELERGTKP